MSNEDDKKILGVITARGGSKGIPRKNIKILGDKPLIAHTIDAAKKSALISHLIVSTDDEEIAGVCREYGVDVPFIRPRELATDEAGHLEVMKHAILEMENIHGFRFDYAVILQPTSPFRTAEDIDGTVNKLFLYPEADSAVSLVEVINNHPVKIKKLNGDRVFSYSVPEVEGTRRQDLSGAYKRSGAVYAMRRDLLIEKNRLYGDHVVGYVVPRERYIDIDDEFDWLKAEYIFKNINK